MTPLSELLTPYRLRLPEHVAADPQPTDRAGWFVRDVPPAVARRALALVDPRLAEERANDQPPARWLVEQAAALDGVLCGFVAPERDVTGDLRFDGIQVGRQHTAELLRAVAAAWPAAVGTPAALDLAVGEVYPTWDTTGLLWKGPARRLAVRAHHGEVVGLWWD